MKENRIDQTVNKSLHLICVHNFKHIVKTLFI